jgi:hypothetical protein
VRVKGYVGAVGTDSEMALMQARSLRDAKTG